MILSDNGIKYRLDLGEIKIKPQILDVQLQPASIDLRLDNKYLPINDEIVKENMEITLPPHELILCQTLEHITLPSNICAWVQGKSSLGRQGIMVHVTAGFIDPSFSGNITLEMYNLTNKPITLKAGDKIAQIIFNILDSPSYRPYGHHELNNHYQGQTVPKK